MTQIHKNLVNVGQVTVKFKRVEGRFLLQIDCNLTIVLHSACRY